MEKKVKKATSKKVSKKTEVAPKKKVSKTWLAFQRAIIEPGIEIIDIKALQ